MMSSDKHRIIYFKALHLYPNHVEQNWLKIILQTKQTQKTSRKTNQCQSLIKLFNLVSWKYAMLYWKLISKLGISHFPIRHWGEPLALGTWYMQHLHTRQLFPTADDIVRMCGWMWVFFSLWRTYIILHCSQCMGRVTYLNMFVQIKWCSTT